MTTKILQTGFGFYLFEPQISPTKMVRPSTQKFHKCLSEPIRMHIAVYKDSIMRHAMHFIRSVCTKLPTHYLFYTAMIDMFWTFFTKTDCEMAIYFINKLHFDGPKPRIYFELRDNLKLNISLNKS